MQELDQTQELIQMLKERLNEKDETIATLQATIKNLEATVKMLQENAVDLRERDKNCTRSSIHLSKSSVNTLLFRNFHYVHLTTCVRLEEIPLLRISSAKYNISV